MAIKTTLLLLSTIVLCSLHKQGLGAKDAVPVHHHLSDSMSASPPKKGLQSQPQGWKTEGLWRLREKNARRLMIGSIAPTCTYNECRGCRFKCRAEQVPVDANDPVNSAYRYRCVCHR